MIFINSDEFSRLAPQGHEAFFLYMVIKNKMDGESRVAGNLKGVNRLSETYLIEQLSYPDGQHHRAAPCNRNRLQLLLSRLKKQGLLKQEGLLCFSFPLATKSNNKSNKLKNKSNEVKSSTYQQISLLENDEIKQQIQPYLNNNISNDILLICPYEKYCPHFLKFWELYPIKPDKPQAWNVWKKGQLDQFMEEILQDVENRIKFFKRWRNEDGSWNKQFIKYPQGYLSGERWKEEWSSSDPKSNSEVQQSAKSLGREILLREALGEFGED